jgi:outer membrane protein
MLRLFTFPALAVCVAGLISSTAAAQTKVGVVNFQKALLDTAELKKASVDLQNKFNPRQDQLEKVQRELADIQTQLQDDVTAERNSILQRSGTRMTEIVKKLAEEKGYDVVVDTQNTYFFKPVLEFTADATAAYDKAYPLK